MRRVRDEHEALALATIVGADSPCAKSKRGAVIFCRHLGLLAVGNNHPPDGFRCDGSEACHANCNKLCEHAEADALAQLMQELQVRRDEFAMLGEVIGEMRPEMLHVKVVDGKAVASGEPSCWQCSRHVINFKMTAFWLLHEDGLRRYEPDEFHEHTLRNRGLPVIR